MKHIVTISFMALLMLSAKGQHISKIKMKELVQLIDTSSAPLVINFWASWCKPCVHEIPWFEKNIVPFEAKNVHLILISLDFADDYPSQLTAFVKEQKYRSPILWLDESDPSKFCALIDPSWQGTIPVTLMVNNKKHYRQFFGQQLPEQRLIKELNRLIE